MTRAGVTSCSASGLIPVLLRFACAAASILIFSPALATVPCSIQWHEFPPSPQRANHVAVYDPIQDRMVSFGGDSDLGLSRIVSALAFDGDPVWTDMATAGVVVPYVSGHAGVYDPVRHRLITIGGMSQTLQSGVWALTLSDTPTWTSLNPSGSGPGPIRWHSAIYDPMGDRVIVFGGRNSGGPLNGTWALSLTGPPSWTSLVVSGTSPSARFDHTAIYDPVDHRMIVYGGDAGSNTGMSDVWALSLDAVPTWTQLLPAGPIPPARWDHSALYDPGSHEMRMLGGWGSGQGVSNDLWALTLDENPTWTQLSPFTFPEPRWIMHSAILDTVRNRMVIFGGRQQNYFLLSESWVFPLTGPMSRSQIRRAVPSAVGHAAIYDPVADRLIVFGGEVAGVKRNDVWRATLASSNLTTARWEMLADLQGPPTGRVDASVHYDPLDNRMILFGGDDGSLRNDTWFLDLDALDWSEIVPVGDLPPARADQASVYVPGSRTLYVFGGYTGTFPVDLWSLDLSGAPIWEEVFPTGNPGGRAGHSLVYDSFRNRVLLFGGFGSGGFRNDVWELKLTGTPRWSLIPAAGTPPIPRAWHAAIYDPIRDRMVVHGGNDGSSTIDDPWELSLSGTPTWAPLCSGPATTAFRQKHSTVYDLALDRMIVYGGLNQDLVPVPGGCEVISWGAVSGVVDITEGSPPTFRLLAAYPNPTSARTSLRFVLSVPDRISAAIFDVQGRQVHSMLESHLMEEGMHELGWDGHDDSGGKVPGGLYFYRFVTSSGVHSRKIVRIP